MLEYIVLYLFFCLAFIFFAVNIKTMIEQSLKNNWQNNLLHLALQFGSAWLFVFGCRNYLRNYHNVEMNNVVFYFLATSITALMYFFLYRKVKLKTGAKWITTGIICALTSGLGALFILSGNVNYKLKNEIIYIYIYITYNLPLIVYIFAFINKKLFFILFTILAILAVRGLPLLPVALVGGVY